MISTQSVGDIWCRHQSVEGTAACFQRRKGTLLSRQLKTGASVHGASLQLPQGLFKCTS